jgi:prevent-host-death family protein
MPTATLPTPTLFSAKDAKAHFGELLDTALGQLVGITKHDRLTAYIVSKNAYESMIERLQTLEDQLWLLKADAARKEGFVDAKTVDAQLNKLKALDNEEIKSNKKRK